MHEERSLDVEEENTAAGFYEVLLAKEAYQLSEVHVVGIIHVESNVLAQLSIIVRVVYQ